MKKKICKDYYHLPGYTGKIPQESQMFGLTRSEMSRRIFNNSHIHTRPDTLFSPIIDLIDNQILDIRANSSITDQIYISDIITSGYTGHIPTKQEKFGKTIKNLFLNSILDFEDDQTQKKYNKFDFKLQKLLENNSITKQDLPKDSILHYTREQIPLKQIRKYAEFYRQNEKDWNRSVYKMCNNNCEKRFISGYQGHCPRLLNFFGETYSVLTHNALNDFTDIYRQKIINQNQKPTSSLIHC
ncbi:unnamed protein product [Rotaria sordida]|uniref:Ciliary microtubule inner protein 2A-C-like domain-containing protein n=1 Tax=Rotaria sordida TaxID=392033 RepID=A0A818JFH3_9BILA|nr:unnamed protein product [Rotaria sordida]